MSRQSACTSRREASREVPTVCLVPGRVLQRQHLSQHHPHPPPLGPLLRREVRSAKFKEASDQSCFHRNCSQSHTSTPFANIPRLVQLILLVLQKSFFLPVPQTSPFSVEGASALLSHLFVSFCRAQDSTVLLTRPFLIWMYIRHPRLLLDSGTIGTRLRMGTVFIRVQHSWEKRREPS